MADARRLVRQVSEPIYQSAGWLKFLGVLSILYGALTALSIVGILVAWLPVWMGVLLYQVATLADEAHVGGDPEMLTKSLGKLRTYFTVAGVLALVGLVGLGLGVVWFAAIVSFMSGQFGEMSSR